MNENSIHEGSKLMRKFDGIELHRLKDKVNEKELNK